MPETDIISHTNTVVDRVMNGIINDIISGKIKPGDKLSTETVPDAIRSGKL